MFRIQSSQYGPLDSAEDITSQCRDHSIELREYDSRWENKQSQYAEDRLASPDFKKTRNSRSVLSNITNLFHDSQAETAAVSRDGA